MRHWSDVTLGDIARGVGRYRPIAALLAVILLVAVLAPGSARERAREQETRDSPGVTAFAPANLGAELDIQDGVPEDDGGTGASAGITSPRTASITADADASRAAEAVPSGAEAAEIPGCDPATGRVRMPSKYAPPCLPLWIRGADNGGSTSPGVTRDTVKVAARHCPSNPATTAVLAAAGIAVNPGPFEEMHDGYLDLYNAHYNTYGRKVVIEFFASNCSDEQEHRADALKVAKDINAFAVLHAGGAFAEELAAHEIISISLAASPQEEYQRLAPYRWARLMSPDKQFTHTAEYIGKRLWSRPAKWAGDATFRTQQRTFGLLYPDVDGIATSVEYLQRSLKRFGAGLIATVGYSPQTAEAQEQARNAIARMKDAGVTSVVMYTDPISTIFFSQEATRQAYFPEWVLTGALLQDGNIFGRTYDQVQWSRAFGPSALQSAQDVELYTGYRLWEWHHGTAPPDESGWVSFQPVIEIFMLGVHLGSPRLTPETFRQGLFSYPASGGAAGGQVMTNQWSFGTAMPWDWADYTAVDDAKEIWWDPEATGKDELGQEGRGMYREVDNSKRYPPGGWPASEPRVFDRQNTATYYSSYPPADDPGDPPDNHHKWEHGT